MATKLNLSGCGKPGCSPRVWLPLLCPSSNGTHAHAGKMAITRNAARKVLPFPGVSMARPLA